MNSPMRVLVIEDDPGMAEALTLSLSLEGHHVDLACTGQAGMQGLSRHPDVVVLDVLLPDMNGFEVLAQIRRGSRVPVLMLTALDEVQWRVRGLKGGADDYLVKPYALAELLARLEALVRRCQEPSPAEVIGYAGLVLDRLKMQVHRNGVRMEVSVKGMQLLEVFLTYPERVISRQALMQGVWGTEVEPGTLEGQMHLLRKSLGDPPLIHTLRGFGYVLREA